MSTLEEASLPYKLKPSDLPELLKNDTNVKVGGFDVDGVIRGKLMSQKKFLSIAETGFGFCSVIFGWDMHDQTYFKEMKISSLQNGYRDILAVVDLSSYRRIPWENNVPFFLVSFREPDGKSLHACPRSLLEKVCARMMERGLGAMAGAEYEFYTFRAPQVNSGPTEPNERNSSATATFLQNHPATHLPHLEEGMMGYSLTRPVHNQEWYYNIFSACAKFRCNLESWHTETGPGVYEAALEYDDIQEMADKAALFKLVVKNISSQHGITPCFMAKPRADLPGNSGHIHISLYDLETKSNLFVRQNADTNPPFEDLKFISDLGRHFLAGVLDGLHDVMPVLAPTINSYKRLAETFWAPVTASWGLEHRVAAIRVISPPLCSPEGTRFEIRLPGADTSAHLVLATILALGYRGIDKKLEVTMPPLGKDEEITNALAQGERLAKSLNTATQRFMRKDSVAREALGDDFVDHFTGTREHELRMWDQAVTDWEVRRYIEMV